jgi:hypothetical protein
MAIRTFGELPGGYSVQSDSELIFHDDGLIEGTLVVETDLQNEGNLRYLMGGSHPQTDDVMLYGMRLRYGRLEKVLATFDCIGTEGRQDTQRVVIPMPSKEMIPIEAHPKFYTSEMAGAESAITSLDGPGSGYGQGSNGARFSVTRTTNKITGFLGFGPGAPANLRAVRYYERNTPVLRATWYSWKDPNFSFKSVIVANPAGAPNNSGVANYLRSAPTAAPVGSVNTLTVWKMTQEYVGSETGWNTAIYDTVTE